MIRIGGNELPGPRNQAGVLGNMCTERYCQPDMWQEDGSCVWSVSLSGQHVNRKQWAPPVRRHQASPGGITLLTCHWPRGQFIFRISNTIAIFVVHNTNNKFSTKVWSLVVEWAFESTKLRKKTQILRHAKVFWNGIKPMKRTCFSQFTIYFNISSHILSWMLKKYWGST